MLDLFRKRGVASFVYTFLIAAVLVIFVVEFRPGSKGNAASLTKRCVAKVRGDCVDEKSYKTQQYLLIGIGFENGVGKMAMDALIERTLLEQEAARLGIRVSDDDVTQELIRGRVYFPIPVAMRERVREQAMQSLYDVDYGFQWRNFGTDQKPFDQQAFESTIQHLTSLTISEFSDEQVHDLLAQRVLELVEVGVRVGEGEAWAAYQSLKNTSTIRYTRFEPAYFGERIAPQDQASVEKWANDHQKDVDDRAAKLAQEEKGQPLLHVRHVLIKVDASSTADQKAALKKKADDVLAKAQAGEDFAKLAKDNSDDATTKDKGGELLAKIPPFPGYDGDWAWTTGAAPGDAWMQSFREGVQKLAVGQFAEIETPAGYEVVNLLGRYDGKAATAYPVYVQMKGDELAKAAADKVDDALNGALPVKIDAALQAKIDDAKKSGKSEADAKSQVLDDATRALVNKVIDDTLASMAPPAPPAPATKPDDKKDDKGATAPKPNDKPADAKDQPPPPPSTPAWQTDDRRPRHEESNPFNATGSPVVRLMDQQVIVDATSKLTAEAPVAPTTKASGDYFVVVLKDRHVATKDEFAKDRDRMVGAILAAKREDAVVNYIQSLRDAAGKDITIDPAYTEKKKDGSGGQAPAPPPEEEGP